MSIFRSRAHGLVVQVPGVSVEDPKKPREVLNLEDYGLSHGGLKYSTNPFKYTWTWSDILVVTVLIYLLIS